MSAPRSRLLQRSSQNVDTEHHRDLSTRIAPSDPCSSRPHRLEFRGENRPRNITTPALHGIWSGAPIITLTDCDRLFAAAESDDHAFLYVDYCNSVSQVVPPLERSAGIAELLRRWGQFHQQHGRRRDRLRRVHNVPIRPPKKRKVARPEAPPPTMGYEDKDAPSGQPDTLMIYDDEPVVVPGFPNPAIASAPAPVAPTGDTADPIAVDPAPDTQATASTSVIPAAGPSWAHWDEVEDIPVEVTNCRLRPNQDPTEIICEGSYPDVADWVPLSPHDWPIGIRAQVYM